jgi:hypothetical protein
MISAVPARRFQGFPQLREGQGVGGRFSLRAGCGAAACSAVLDIVRYVPPPRFCPASARRAARKPRLPTSTFLVSPECSANYEGRTRSPCPWHGRSRARPGPLTFAAAEEAFVERVVQWKLSLYCATYPVKAHQQQRIPANVREKGEKKGRSREGMEAKCSMPHAHATGFWARTSTPCPKRQHPYIY